MASGRFSCSVPRLLAILSLTGLTLFAGCSGNSDGLSDYDRMKLDETNAVEAIKSKGAKVEERRYPQGDAWSINLSGLQITDETFEQLKSIGKISELNFSGSTLSDAHAEKLNAMEVSGLVVKLDLSKTEFSDAGLAALTNMNLLQEVTVTGSKITKDGVQKFKQARQKSPTALFKNVTVKE